MQKALALTYSMIIEFDGIPVEITRKKIKNMSLRIYPPDGLLKVSAPLKYSEQLIRHTLETKSTWIRQHQERIRNQSLIEEFPLETGASILFRGKKYVFMIKEHHGPTQIKIQDELLYCYTLPGRSQQQKQMILDTWYKRQMHAVLPDLIHHWETIIGVKVAQWGIKKMKTRWGSCNINAARIWLNLSLIKKPPICLEYVIVHELVHLLEPSHNKRFYELMSQFMPQWHRHEQMLKGNVP